MNAQINKFLLPMLLQAVLIVPVISSNAQVTKRSADNTHRRLVVSLSDRRLALIEDGKVKKVYTVAVGKESTPSPTGTFTIMNRVRNPSYSHDGKVIAPGPENPVGTRWIGLSAKGYGIHGTNEPGSIGKAASHGCIRMRKSDLEDLFASVEKGDQVEIVGGQDPETAELFGDRQGVEAPLDPTRATEEVSAPTLSQATPGIAIAAAMPLAQ
jgi:lipoprotein-anchoring transpeptidase ErfK/SrfK